MVTYEKILVGIDFGPLSVVAVEAASSLADRFASRKLQLVHVAELLPTWAAPRTGDLLTRAWEQTLSEAGKMLGEFPVPKTKTEVTRTTRIGSPARELADEARDKHADLVVVASHDRGIAARAVLGSVASTLLRVAPCPVWIVGRDRPGTAPIRRILAAIDLSPISPRVLEEAARVARAMRAELTVLSLYDVPMVQMRPPLVPPLGTAEQLATLEAAHRAKVEALVDTIRTTDLTPSVTLMRKAPPANAIRDVAEMLPADLIVIGTSGHNAWQRLFLGSTATRVATASPCPVLCVPNAE